MKLLLCLYDSKGEYFLSPFAVPSLGVAYRDLADQVAKVGGDNMLANHPGDFELYKLGVYDEESGLIQVEKAPALVCRLSDLKVSDE